MWNCYGVKYECLCMLGNTPHKNQRKNNKHKHFFCAVYSSISYLFIYIVDSSLNSYFVRRLVCASQSWRATNSRIVYKKDERLFFAIQHNRFAYVYAFSVCIERIVYCASFSTQARTNTAIKSVPRHLCVSRFWVFGCSLSVFMFFTIHIVSSLFHLHYTKTTSFASTCRSAHNIL